MFTITRPTHFLPPPDSKVFTGKTTAIFFFLFRFPDFFRIVSALFFIFSFKFLVVHRKSPYFKALKRSGELTEAWKQQSYLKQKLLELEAGETQKPVTLCSSLIHVKQTKEFCFRNRLYQHDKHASWEDGFDNVITGKIHSVYMCIGTMDYLDIAWTMEFAYRQNITTLLSCVL